MTVLAAFCLSLFLSLPLLLLRGVVLADLVGWFTPWEVGVVQMAGLALVAGLLTAGHATLQQGIEIRRTLEGKPGPGPFGEVLVSCTVSVTTSLVAWGMGWVVQLFL